MKSESACAQHAPDSIEELGPNLISRKVLRIEQVLHGRAAEQSYDENCCGLNVDIGANWGNRTFDGGLIRSGQETQCTTTTCGYSPLRGNRPA